MASKIIAKLIVAGTQVFGRAFMQAYRQAVANQAKNPRGGQNASTGTQSGAASSATNEFTRKTGLSLEESHLILNTTKESAPSDILKKYQHLFDVNDASKKGSFYLQSKVVRARERIEMELGNPLEEPKPKSEAKPEEPKAKPDA